MAKEFEITDEMRAQIGSESPPWIHEVTTTSVRAFARGVGYTDPVYFDVDVARKAGYRSLPAPPTLPRHAGVHPRPLERHLQRADRGPAGDEARARRACSTAAPRPSTSTRSAPATR